MNGKTLMLAALGAVVLAGCKPARKAPAVAFKLAETSAVVVNTEGLSKGEAAGVKGAAAELTNMIFRVTGHAPAVYEERDCKLQIANCKAQCGNGQGGKAQNDNGQGGKAQNGNGQGGKAQPSTPSTPSTSSTLNSQPPLIYLGVTESAKEAGLGGEGLRNGDWRIKTVPGKAFLYAKTSYAAYAAVSDFGQRFCDYHVVFADGHDVWSENSTLALPLADAAVKPVIYGRNVYHGMYDGYRYPTTKAAWERYARMRLGDTPFSIEGKYRVSSRTGSNCHSQFAYIPPEKYCKDHPEYYCMTPDGKRRAIANAGSQICFTNPDTYRIVLASLRRFIAADRKEYPKDPPLVYDFTHLDNSSFLCCCPECRKVIAKYNRKPGGHEEGGDAGLQLEFVNRLARDIRADYPDVIIRTFAYVSTECAPKPGTIRPEPNVRIWWCDVYSHSDHTIPLETPGHFNERQAKELDEWAELTDNLEVWDYMLYGLPEFAPDAFKADAQLYARYKIPLVMMETEYRGQPFYDLNYYLLTRLYVDPTLEIDPLLRIYSRGFRRGADDMYAALQFLRGEIGAHHSADNNQWRTRSTAWLEAPTMEKFAGMIRAVYDKEPSPVVRGRVTRMLASVYRQLVTVYRKNPKAKAELARSVENYRRFGLESAEQSFMEPKDRKGAKAGVETAIELLTLQFKDFPAELKAVPADELVCVDFHIRRDGPLVKDAASERGRAVKAEGAAAKGAYMSCGIYDEDAKDSFGMRIPFDKVPNDGKYHWVELKKCHIGRASIFWFPGSWACSFWLKDQHIISDGVAIDPNWYVLWASARQDGKSMYVDRLAFRRVKP